MDAHRLSGGDAQLLAHEIDAVGKLRHRMLDLNACVHLQEEELARRRKQKFDRARADISDGPRRGRRGFRQTAPQRRRYRDRWRFFDQLLMAALDAAFALAQCDDSAVPVRQYLDLDVPRSLEIFFDVDTAIAERFQGFAPGGLKRSFDIRLGADEPHAFATATCHGLQEDRIADPLRFAPRLHRIAQRRRGTRDHRYARGLHAAARFGFVAHRANRLGRRTDEDESRIGTRFCKSRALREKAVSRMHRLAAGVFRRGDELLDVEVGFRRRRGAEQHGGVGIAHMWREPVRFGVDGHRSHALFMAGADHANRDFTAIGDENPADGRHRHPTSAPSSNVSKALHSAPALLTARR